MCVTTYQEWHNPKSWDNTGKIIAEAVFMENKHKYVCSCELQLETYKIWHLVKPIKFPLQ